jgi:hypothetical protein
MADKRQLTTVTIDTDTGARLERLAKANGVSKKEFISLSLEYFEKYGINPAQHESPAQEMQKLIKRVDQIVAFQKVQEREFVRPAMGAVMETEARIKGDLTRIAQSYDKMLSILQNVLTNDEAIEAIIKSHKHETEELKRAVMVLAKHMDEKNKAGLMGKLFG